MDQLDWCQVQPVAWMLKYTAAAVCFVYTYFVMQHPPSPPHPFRYASVHFKDQAGNMQVHCVRKIFQKTWASFMVEAQKVKEYRHGWRISVPVAI